MENVLTKYFENPFAVIALRIWPIRCMARVLLRSRCLFFCALSFCVFFLSMFDLHATPNRQNHEASKLCLPRSDSVIFALWLPGLLK